MTIDMADALSIVLVAVLGLIVSLAVRRLRRQTNDERLARTEVERRLRQTNRLQQLTATLSRARTPDDVVGTCLPELQRAIAARTAEFRSTPCDGLQELPEGALAVPLIATSGPIGAIALTFEPARRLDRGERDFLLAAGRHMGQALDRARLYEATERARAEAEGLRVRAAQELLERQKAEEALRLSEARYRSLAARTSRLYALNAGLSESVTLEAVARVIVQQGKVVVGASTGSVVLLASGGSRFEMLYEDDRPAQPGEPRRQFASETGLCATAAVEARRPIFIGSFAEWQQRYPRSASIAADGGFASAAELPLLADGAVFGVLSLYFTVPVNFDEEYRALLTSVAQHCAQALDRARLYETAERARADAETANRSKDDFLSTISHELRTPLNAILGWAAMLRSGSVDAHRTGRAIEAIYNNATRQGRLIEELLDVSRIVAGRASIDLQDVDLGESIRGAVEAMMPAAAARRVELRLVPTPGVHVSADPRRLEQVFLNLLSNAVKFTPADGCITVDVAVSGASVCVRVADSGDGIDPAFLPHVFERFRQADSTTTRGVGGLGLGLFIARQLVEAQGGTIRVESEGLGHGSAFIVTLPGALAAERLPVAGANELAPPASTPAEEPMPELRGVRVLLVDDEPDAMEVMASALERCGATVMTSSCARDALQMLNRTEVDLLLSDIAMPGQDGYALIREIRALPSTRLAAIPAAAVTAHARDDERERALAAGFQAHLTKPVHPAALARAVAALAGSART